MSLGSIERAQVRRYLGFPQTVLLGLTTQTIDIEFETVKPTKLISFGVQSVTTVPANDPLTNVWCTEIEIIVNKDQRVVPQMSRQDYIDIVQNIECKEADNLAEGEGNMFYKVFDPPLAAKTSVQIRMNVNTLALATTTPAASCALYPVAYAFDSMRAPERKLIYYVPIPVSPATPGVTANVPFSLNLGVHARIVKRVILMAEDPLGTPSPTFLGFLEIMADGQAVFNSNAPEGLRQYLMDTDGLYPIHTGIRSMKFPESGFQAAANNQLQINLTPYLTSATGQVRGYEVYQKNY